jgi:hypothetical protein
LEKTTGQERPQYNNHNLNRQQSFTKIFGAQKAEEFCGARAPLHFTHSAASPIPRQKTSPRQTPAGC